MTNKEFIERLKANDLIYETDENGNVIITKTNGEIFKNHFKQLEKELEILDILKNKMPMLSLIKLTPNQFEYESKISGFKTLTAYEYNLIKEWLDNDK